MSRHGPARRRRVAVRRRGRARPGRPAAGDARRRRAAGGRALPGRARRAGRAAGRRAARRLRRAGRSAVPDGEAAKTAAVAADCWEALGEAGFTRSDAVVDRRRRGHHRPRRLRRRDLAARRARRARARPPCSAMVDAAVGGKTGINTGAGKNLVGVLPRARRRAVRPRPAGDPAARRAGRRPGRGGQVRLHRRPRDPRRWSRQPTRPRLDAGVRRCCASWSSGRSGSRSTSWSADLKETGGADGHPGPRGAQLRPHAGPRDRARRAATPCGTARRSPSAASTSPSWPAGPARSPARSSTRHRDVLRPGRAARRPTPARPFEDLHAAMRVDKKARGSPAAVRRARRPRPAGGSSPGPSEDDLRAAYDAIERRPRR